MSAKQKHFFLILILGSLTALGPFSIDMYLPSFPAIAKDLDTTIERVALSLSSYFVGISAGQLLYGPLLDKYGRKKPLYIGLAVYLLASFGCMMVNTVDGLIGLRFIQAIGSCAAAVAAVAMVRDLFPIEENAKVFALLMLVVGASPMIAPTVGGYVTASLGWHAIFLILAGIAVVILLAVIFALPDKYIPNRNLSLKPGPMLASFWEVLKNPQFFTYVFTGALSFAGLFAYVAGSPLVFMEMYHVSEKGYGWIFAGLSVGFIGSSQVNSWLLKRGFTSRQIIPVALTVQVLAGLVFVLVAMNGWMGLNRRIGYVVYHPVMYRLY
ncbi:multidrug effflux MFS transporter [Mucilaginibacter terrae]|uniref:DHA1 family bicyclomycin/chloramphenicol resistance-like MFS transporter n=1 Tax=Mucilaginibacter terrae TaxID=1955052 RepID=A0ABU3GXS4_9SPHI|nr:multidrug effflux MFS transporter [Mucilaginibacter terrae]MDT3403475.1 DHA1 family bicyclomycin/chloramphenicol resistance-like MFS transporter [Mucilaginibacter terrae]